jgi:benzoyl-CoA reductase/2-hydroxyglutaryl-CoA dehydratase subunit BcrC/BadD/HgdB
MAVKDNQPRLLLTGSPVIFPNFKLPLLIEEMGGLLAADETCMGERGLYDPPVIVDSSLNGMMRALANRATRPCTCPTFADNRRRLYRVRQMIGDYHIQGVVYHVLRGCLVYDYEYAVMEAEMERLGIPIIRVETDYNEEDVEQLRIRIEAFIELIKYGGNDT